MHLTAPAIFAPSGMNGWPVWLLITPALGVRPSCAGWLLSWLSPWMRPRLRRWR